MRTKTILSALVFRPVNAVLFGAGLIPVLAIPELRSPAMILIPVVVAASLSPACGCRGGSPRACATAARTRIGGRQSTR